MDAIVGFFTPDNVQTLVWIIGSLLGVASVITGLTPTTADDAVVKRLIGWFSFVTHKNIDGTFKLPFTSMTAGKESAKVTPHSVQTPPTGPVR